jgi:hypothetical protein
MMPSCHPHPNKQHVVSSYRNYILGCKRKFGTARSQVKYRELMATYILAKRERDGIAREAQCTNI